MASSSRPGNLFLYGCGFMSLALLAVILWVVRGPQPYIDSEERRSYQANLQASNSKIDPGSNLVLVDGKLWIRQNPSEECAYYCATATRKADGTFAVQLPVGFQPYADPSVRRAYLRPVTSLTYWNPAEHERMSLESDGAVTLPRVLTSYGSVRELGWEVRFAPASFVRVTPDGKAFLFDHSLRYEKLDAEHGFSGPDAQVMKGFDGTVYVELPSDYEPLVWHAKRPKDSVPVILSS